MVIELLPVGFCQRGLHLGFCLAQLIVRVADRTAAGVEPNDRHPYPVLCDLCELARGELLPETHALIEETGYLSTSFHGKPIRRRRRSLVAFGPGDASASDAPPKPTGFQTCRVTPQAASNRRTLTGMPAQNTFRMPSPRSSDGVHKPSIDERLNRYITSTMGSTSLRRT